MSRKRSRSRIEAALALATATATFTLGSLGCASRVGGGDTDAIDSVATSDSAGSSDSSSSSDSASSSSSDSDSDSDSDASADSPSGDTLDWGEDGPDTAETHDEAHGLTWVVRGSEPDLGVVLVGTDGISDPYVGDTPCTMALPILCIDRSEELANPGVEVDGSHGWSGGLIELSEPVTGDSLASLIDADARCVELVGPNFEMADFHHLTPGGGWNWWAFADLDVFTPEAGRFWVYIRDQPGNCWDY